MCSVSHLVLRLCSVRCFFMKADCVAKNDTSSETNTSELQQSSICTIRLQYSDLAPLSPSSLLSTNAQNSSKPARTANIQLNQILEIIVIMCQPGMLSSQYDSVPVVPSA